MKPALETERLLLRRFTLEDVDVLLEIFSDPEAMRYYSATKTREETVKWIEFFFAPPMESGFCNRGGARMPRLWIHQYGPGASRVADRSSQPRVQARR